MAKTKAKKVKAAALDTIEQPPSPEANGEALAPVAANPHNLPVIYAKLEVTEYSTASKKGPITPALAKKILKWETEKEYQKRMVREDPASAPEHWLFGDDYHCRNAMDEKVRCYANANNRSFDLRWCEALVHTILYGQWAGPLTVNGETVNGETVRISRYGRILSGQHQLTALILADEFLQKSRGEALNMAFPKYPFWNGYETCLIETLVVAGVSEDERVLRTIDYVKPRTVADMLHTMDVFRSVKTDKGEKRDTTPVERKELTRMLASAIDTLWERTDTKGYRTHPEIVGFLERHRSLLECVELIFRANAPTAAGGGRKISKLKLGAGLSAALHYLMGASGPGTDGDVYRNEIPPSEANLDWSNWDCATEFWTKLGDDPTLSTVRVALERVSMSSPTNADNRGMGGSADEKFAILARAWDVYKDHPDSAGPAFDGNDLEPGGALCLAYSNLADNGSPLPDGAIKLLDIADFNGIDCPDGLVAKHKREPVAPPMSPPPSAAEIEAAKAEANRRRGILPPDELQKKNEEEEAKRRREAQAKKLLESRAPRK